MADIDYAATPSAADAAPDPSDQNPGALGRAADFGKTLGAGALDVGSNLAAAARYAFEAGGSAHGADISAALEDLLGGSAEDIRDSMNDESKKAAASAAFTSSDFWAHPILATALKATGMVPAVAAMAIPGGLLADTVAATMAAAASGAAINAGAGIDEFYKKLDAMPDDELQDQSVRYKALREVMDEKTARAQFAQQSMKWGPAINAVIGAAAASVGPAGTAARSLAGGAENVAGAAGRGALASGAIAGTEGAVGNAAQAGVADVNSQQANVNAQLQKEIDLSKTAQAAVEGGALGGLTGGIVGAVLHGGETPPPSTADKITKVLQTADADSGSPAANTASPQPQTGATGSPAKPVESPQVGNPQNAPVRGSRAGAKTPKGGKTNAPVDTPAAGGPDVAQKAALDATQPAPVASATEVAAAAPVGSTSPVPPDVAAASQRIAAAQPQGAALDTNQNVPEKPATLAAQQDQLGTPSRKAVMYPTGTDVPKVPKGMQKITTPRGTFHYDPKQTNVAEIRELSKLGQENQLLGLGPVSKPDAVASAAAGATPVAVTERTPGGTEVKAAAGTSETAPAQVAALENSKTPGNVVGVETPENVLQMRTSPEVAPPRTGRVLRRLDNIDETAPLDVNKNLAEGQVKEAKGKKYSESELQAKQAKLDRAQAIVEKNGPGDGEENYLKEPAHRDRIVERAQNMVREADEAGIKIQKQLKASIKGDAASDHPATQILTAAKALVDVSKKNKQGQKRTDAAARFKQDEAMIRAGYSGEVLAQRRAEGDEAAKARYNKKSAEDADAAPASKEGRATKLADGTEVTSAGITRAKGNPVRQIELTPEERAKYETPAKPKVAVPKDNALEVNEHPTEAQKAAGNYKKGHITIDGLRLSLENRKGGERSGIDPATGKPWKVKMPADYGYIKGTVGADKDHVDAYDGRRGTKHFIVDQLDAETGKFDEHKVMLRFKDEAAARDAYERSFSDGRGASRLGHIHEVSMPELKEWLNEGNLQDPHIQHVVGDLDRVNFDATPEASRRGEIVAGNGVRVRPLRSTTAGAELRGLDFSKTPGVAGIVSRFFQYKLDKLAAGVKVHYVTDADMLKLHPKGLANGLHVVNQLDGTSEVYLRKALDDEKAVPGEAYSKAHVILHELAHAVTVREIVNIPGAEKLIKTIGDVADKYINDNLDALRLEFHDGTLNYAFKNTKEFVAEAFGNPEFQELLSRIPVDDKMARGLGLDKTPKRTLWDMFRRIVHKAIERVTGTLPENPTVLDAILRVGEHLTNIHDVDNPSTNRDSDFGMFVRNRASNPEAFMHGQTDALMKQAEEGVKKMLGSVHLQTAERAPFALKLRTFDNIARLADHYFGAENNPIRKIHNAIEAMRVKGEMLFQKSSPIVQKLVSLRALNSETFKEFSSLLHDATIANVHPDVDLNDAKNAHLGKKKIIGGAVWSKAQHPQLAARFDALPKEYKAAWHDVVNYFTDQQNKMSLGIINNHILKLLGINDEALGQRIHEGTLTDADRGALGSNLEAIENAKELSKIEGPYVPLMRRGDFVVKGDYKVATPKNAKVISPNEFEFNTEKEATSYAKGSDLKPTIKKVWVDENTGELHQADPVTGEPHKMSSTDVDSVPRYRVEVQNSHLEFHSTRASAEARAAELAKAGTMDVHKVVPRAYEPGGRQATDLSAALAGLVKKLERSEAYKQSTPSQQAALRQAVQEASAASHGSTRIQSKSLPRRGVKGYSEDIVQNTVDYALSSSRYLAKIEHAPAIEAGMKAMEDQLKTDESKTNQFGRTSIRNEVVKRVQGDVGFEQGGKFSGVVKRAMAVSFMDKLASPAYSVINAMQPGMVTMPYLSGRHGIARSFGALGKAYNDVGAFKVVRQGVAETYRHIKGSSKPDDFIGEIKSRLASRDERDLVDELVRTGSVDPAAGFEIRTLVQDTSGVGGKIDKAIGYLEGVTREMPRAIEAINRTVTALAAYRLERARGATHEQGVQYAQDAVNATQFNYSPTNAPKIFNHPLAKIALQFKKYGQGMYQLIGEQVGKAVRNSSPGDRKAAVKTLITLAASHTAVAGVLGLPTEPFKYLLMGAAAAGLPVGTWSNVEDQIRQEAANLFGKTGGEVLTRGLPRLFNLDLSRVGLDSVTSFGEPRSQKDSDVKSWLFDSLAGPVVSLGGDWIKGLNQITNGDFEKAAENLIPIKAASDSLRAYRQATEGKKSASGRQTMSSYTSGETAARVLGFGSGREAEIGAANSAFYQKSEAQKEARSELINAWAQASPTAKTASMAAITKWNQGKDASVQIKPKELTAKLQRDRKADSTSVHGLVANKRDKRFLAEGQIYDTGQ